jgi:hypothetical protein
MFLRKLAPIYEPTRWCNPEDHNLKKIRIFLGAHIWDADANSPLKTFVLDTLKLPLNVNQIRKTLGCHTGGYEEYSSSVIQRRVVR